MSKKTKVLLTSLIFLAATVTGSAQAATLHHPGSNGGCGASGYEDYNYGAGDVTYFSVPAIANGAEVWVDGATFNTANNTVTPARARFTCSNGVLSTDNPYNHSVSWEPW